MKYRGLAIGGPLDGEYVEGESNLLRLPKDGEVRYLSNGERAAHQPDLFFNYIFVSRYWLPYSERVGARAITDALDILDRVYVRHTNEKRAEKNEE